MEIIQIQTVDVLIKADHRLLDHDTSSTHSRHKGQKFLDLAKIIGVDFVE